MEIHQHPFFSVVIPTYNRADLILNTLASVFEQTYTNYEIIVVDNCSTDNTIDVLEPFVKEGKIKLIKNAKNLERARARNVGLKSAKGDFLTLLDSDDFMYPTNLQDAASFVVENKELQFFHNRYELVNSKKECLKSYKFPENKDHIKQLANGNFISCIGVFISREIYSSYFFNEDEKILGSEDWELWIRVISKYKLGSIPKVNSGALFHKGRSISSYGIASIAERKIYILDCLFKNKDVKRVFGKYEQSMRASAYIFTAVCANEAKLFDESKKYLKKAYKIQPKVLLKKRFLRVAQIANFKIDKTLKTE